jgi:hypothetical protein
VAQSSLQAAIEVITLRSRVRGWSWRILASWALAATISACGHGGPHPEPPFASMNPDSSGRPTMTTPTAGAAAAPVGMPPAPGGMASGTPEMPVAGDSAPATGASGGSGRGAPEDADCNPVGGSGAGGAGAGGAGAGGAGAGGAGAGGAGGMDAGIADCDEDGGV